MRRELSEEILRVRDAVAVAVTETFLSRHPDWIARYGDRARVRGEEDAGHHLNFLAAAVEIGEPRSFVDYTRWCCNVLESRGIAAAFLLENLEAIEVELARRVSPATAEVAAIALRAGMDELSDSPAPEGDGDELPLALARRLYTEAAVSARRKDALAIVRETLKGGSSLLDVYTYIFQESLYEIGRRWASTGLTVAEEHMATATTQFILSVLYEEAPPAPIARGKAIITGVGGELHQVGANIVADALDSDGWDVRFMGTNMPQDAILAAIDEHGATLVGISATTVANVGHVRDVIAGIRERSDESRTIHVGGGAFRAYPELWRQVGADGFAPDVRSAVELARV